MKKIIALLTVFTLVFYGCQDVNDKFDWLEEATKPENIRAYTHTIVDEDYSTIVSAASKTDDAAAARKLQTDKAFSEQAPAETLIPYLLGKKFYTADVKSSAMVTYLYNNGRDAVVSGLSGAGFIPTDADFKKVWSESMYVNAFTPKRTPDRNLPNMLKNNFPDATEGTYKNIQYEFSAEEPIDATIEGELHLSETFEERGLNNNDYFDFEGWTNIDLKGKRKWQAKAYNNNFYAQYSSNGSKSANEAWLITSLVDLSKADSPYFSFDVTAGYYNGDCLTILVSDKYNGKDIQEDQWEDITSLFELPKGPASGYGTLSTAGAGSMAKYKGKKIHIAFRYQGDDTADPKRTTTFQIDNIKVFEGKIGLVVENTTTQYATYLFNGTAWNKAGGNIITLQPENYATMGLSKGTLAVAEAANYLPVFLTQNYPYAQVGDEKVIVYKTGNAAFYADRLRKEAGAWIVLNFTEVKSDQFVRSDKGWIFDPTITITLTANDYQLVVDYVKENQGVQTPALVSSYGNTEYYYGFNAYNKNITFRPKDRQNDPTYPNGSAEENMKFCKERTLEGLELFLGIKYPNAQPIVGGVEQYAKLTLTIFYDSNPVVTEDFIYELQCTGNKEWKFLQRTSLKTNEVEKAESN